MFVKENPYRFLRNLVQSVFLQGLQHQHTVPLWIRASQLKHICSQTNSHLRTPNLISSVTLDIQNYQHHAVLFDLNITVVRMLIIVRLDRSESVENQQSANALKY